jgi:ABC-type multidrug transport system ATPase subunit
MEEYHNRLEIKGLTKRFGEKTLFEGLSLTVDGPAVLWAPSGWGKTTLLRILMGLEVPTSGSVEGVGRVGAVFQEDRLCPQLTAEENVALVLPAEQYKAKTKYKEQIREDLIQLGLDDEALALPARKLSGGQKRRAALLRALWAESDTLLLDEPFTGMDLAAMKKAAAILKARCGAKPVLLATHDQAAIRELGWRVIELG